MFTAVRTYGLTSLGRFYPVLTFFARLPFSMVIVGALTVIVTGRGSAALGGVSAALLGVANACFAPFLGAAASKFGQRPILIIASGLNALAMLSLVLVTASSLPDAVVVCCAVLTGATIPMISPFSRSRDNAFLETEVAKSHLAPEQLSQVRTKLFAHESVLDEIGFVAGPIFVGLVGSFINPGAALIVAACWTALGGVMFATHPSVRFLQTAASTDGFVSFLTPLKQPAVLHSFVNLFAIGTVFGSSVTSLTASLNTIDLAAQAGIWYGLMGVSSAVLALSVSWFSPRFSHTQRLIVFSFVTVLGAICYALFPTPSVMLALALLLTGVGVGPVLVTGFALGAERASATKLTMVMTVLSAGITLGQSLASAVTGQIAEHISPSAAVWFTSVCALFLLGASFTNHRYERLRQLTQNQL